MKRIIIVMMAMMWTTAFAQNSDERMERDLRVAEDVLGSLIKQQFDQSAWLPVDVQASYRSGFGVTFSIPSYSNFPINYIVMPKAPRAPRVQVYGGEGDGYTYTIETDEDGDVIKEEIEGHDLEDEIERAEDAKREAADAKREAADAMRDAQREMGRAWNKSGVGVASTTAAASKNSKEYNQSLVEAAKVFIADYSSIISQLKPEERIIITNRSNEGGGRYWKFMGDEKRYFLSVEASGSDIKQYQSGKLTRDQFIARIKTIESEVEAERSQDLELLITIFDRLYDSDLSRTFFTEGETYYERLKDYGAIFYMNVFSSNQLERGYFSMPTQNLEKVSEEERNKKVTELYPSFEKELKENILEYGRTVRTLKPEEVLVFNVRLTKCKGCGIPSTIEITTKASVLNDYLTGKLDKNAALAKLEVKKGANQ